MSKYFKLSEFTKTDTGLDNIPDSRSLQNIEKLSEVLDIVRENFSRPIYISSGYRSLEINYRVGGVKGSAHLKGLAADITTYNLNLNEDLFKVILELRDKGIIKFDQLIKYPGFIHFSIDKRFRDQIIKK